MTRRIKAPRANSTTGGDGRLACTKSVSMMPEDWDWICKRVAALSPRVKGVSHYFQMLADMDKRDGLLEKFIGATSGDSGAGERVAREMAADVIQGMKARRNPSAK